MAQRRISDTVARLIALSRPAYVDGKWQKPAISNTELRLLRRRLVLSGEYWPPKPLRNIGADPPIKLTERELNRPARYGAPLYYVVLIPATQIFVIIEGYDRNEVTSD